MLGGLAQKLAASPFTDLSLGQAFVDPEDLRSGSASPPSPLSLVVFPNYEPGSLTTLVPVGRAAGVVELVNNCITFERLGGKGLEAIAVAAQSARFYMLRSGHLSDAVDAIFALARRTAR